MKIRTISELTGLAGKYVLLREDFNVQLLDGKVANTFRLSQSLPTIRYLKEKGARVVIISHLGRPDGKPNPKYSLAPVALALSELLGEPVAFHPDCLGAPIRKMRNGDVMMLENVRFHAGEEANDPAFANALAAGFDIFVNDAFAVSHRAHASVVGVAKILPSYAGELLAAEVSTISKLMKKPKRPLMGIIAGAKVSSKIGVLKSLVKICDTVAIAGGLGNTFKFALGANIGNSLHEPELKDAALEILELAKKNNCDVLLPIDKGVAKTESADAARTDKAFGKIQPNDIIMDEGPKSIAEYERAIDKSKTLVWNGTLGVAEWQPTWSAGTFAIARHVARRTRAGKLESIIGGGETEAALQDSGTDKDMTYVSTGGGAFLEFIEGRKLPGIAALGG